MWTSDVAVVRLPVDGTGARSLRCAWLQTRPMTAALREKQKQSSASSIAWKATAGSPGVPRGRAPPRGCRHRR
jgi:hypothetical protein